MPIESLPVDLAAAYPGCPTLVSLGEDEAGQTFYQAARRIGLSVKSVVVVIIKTCTRASDVSFPFGACFRHNEPSCLRCNKDANAVLGEMGHPDARRYIAAKLGAM